MGMIDPAVIVSAAKAWYAAGCCVVPPRTDGSKGPISQWKNYQTDRPDAAQMSDWYEVNRQQGVGLICGKVSGGLEMLELEGRASDTEHLDLVVQACRDAGILWLWDTLTSDGYAEWTPSGGIHLLYRIIDHEIPGNTKIASRPKRDEELTEHELTVRTAKPDAVFMTTLAETRGEGGYVIVAPSGGTVHPTGDSWTVVAGQIGKVPAISWDDRCLLHAAITAALDIPAPRPVVPLKPALPRLSSGAKRPGDDFNDRADWRDILEPYGWTISHQTGAETFWCRPGKGARDGHSASTGYAGDSDRLYVWSSSTVFPTEEPISKFAAYAELAHAGDFAAATRALVRDGYGEQRTVPAPRQQFGDYVPPVPPFAEAVDHLLAAETKATPVQAYRRNYCQTSVGNAERMVDMYARDFRYIAGHKMWMSWDGVRWVPDAGGARVNAANTQMTYGIKGEAEQLLAAAPEGKELKAAEALYGWFKTSQMDRGMKGTLSQFSQRMEISTVPAAFDQVTGYINTHNGLYGLDGHEIRPHERSHMGTKVFASSYEPEASCPQFEKFMAEVLPDPGIRAYVRRAAGYSLLGRPDQRAIMLLHGPSGTGKSQFLEIMHGVFGDYGQTASAGTLRKMDNKGEGATPGLHSLKGARFVSTSETSADTVLDEELIKRLTGTDTVRSRALYQDEESWKPQCVIWIATNHLPKLTSTDDAIWRRVKPIHFATRFTPKGTDGTKKETPNLAAKILAAEAPGILNWLLAGLKEFQELGGLDEPDQVTKAVTAYRDESDHVRQFWNEMVGLGAAVEKSNEFIPFKTVFRVYESWCQDNRVRFPLGMVNFGRRIRDLLDIEEFPKAGGVVKVPGWAWIPVNGVLGTL